MEGHHETMQERQSRSALKELCDVGTTIEGVVPQAPSLKSRAWHLECFRGLTLGDALDSQLPVLLKEVCAFKSVPAWLATIRVALLTVLNYGSHSDLLCQSLAFVMMMAKDAEVALSFQPLLGVELLIFRGSHESQVADPTIKALQRLQVDHGTRIAHRFSPINERKPPK